MTDEKYLRFIEGSMTEEEEAAFLRDRPDVWREVQVSMYADGELPEADRREVEADLAASAHLQRTLTDIQVLSAIARPTEAPRRPSSSTKTTAKGAWWLRWPLFGGLATAVAASVALVMMRGTSSDPANDFRLSDGIENAAGLNFRAGHTAHQGDVLVASAPLQAGRITGLRIYRREVPNLVLSCPGASICERSSSSMSVRFAFEQPGVYDVLWLHSPVALPASVGVAEDDVEALPNEADFEIQTISVRPAR